MKFHARSSLWHVILAPIVWAVHFVFVYGWTAVACTKADAADLARLGIAIATIVALVLILLIGWRAWRQWDFTDDWDHVHNRGTAEDRREFLGHAGWLLSVVAAIGVLFVAAPAFYIETCL